MRFEDLSHRFDQSLAGRRQPIHLGSYGVVGASPTRDMNAACTWTVLVQAGARRRRPGVAGGGSRRCRHHAADRREWRDGAYHVRRHHDRARDRRTRCSAARWYRVWLAVDPTGGRVLVGQQPLDGAPVTARGIGTRRRPAVGRHGADRGRERRSPATSFHRQARGSRDPARLRRIVARCRCNTRCASRRPAGRLGLFAWHRHAGDHRHRAAGVPWPPGQHADARHGRHALDRPRAMLAACAARLRRDPFPRRRSGRLRVGRRISPGPCRTICAAAPMRCI